MQFNIVFEDVQDAEIVIKSLQPEIVTSPSSRSSTDFNLKDKTLTINIQAVDVTSLRASVNSYLRWIMLSHDIMKLKDIN
jgi:KEOPS complex subunit Pcc1